MNIQIKSKRFHVSLGMQSRLNFSLRKLTRFQLGLKSASVLLETLDDGEEVTTLVLSTSFGVIEVSEQDLTMGKAIRKAFTKAETEMIALCNLQGWEEPLEKTGLLLH